MKLKPSVVLILLSLVLFISDVTFVAINYFSAKDALETAIQETNHHLESKFFQALQATEDRMVHLATYVAGDTSIQQLFLQGKLASIKEGSAAGGPLTTDARNKLYDKVKDSRDALAAQYDYRQLHFHLPPGSNSFLRVHKPEKYGDNMDFVRHTIVHTNQYQIACQGFETGRVYSGIRGVVPVFATDKREGRRTYVGALENGTSFQTTLEAISSIDSVGASIILTQDHLRQNVWPDFLDQMIVLS